MIRRCEETDLPEIAEIEKLSFSHPYPLFVFRRYLRAYFFISEEKGKIIGYVIGVKIRVKGVITSIAVHPSFRRKGHGRALIEHVEKEMDMPVLEIQVRRSNTVAREFYLALGFEEKEVLPHYYHNGEDAYVMVKKSR